MGGVAMWDDATRSRAGEGSASDELDEADLDRQPPT